MSATGSAEARPTARFWYDLSDLGDVRAGPALSDALLAEEATCGVTMDVAWAYADAMPALLGRDPMVDLLPLAFGRGALRAAALSSPVDLDGLQHVQTRSPDVCRAMGSRVPSFAVRGEECVRALLERGTAVREVVATHCVPFAVDAPFRLRFPEATDPIATRWFRSYLAEHFMPIVKIDVDVWLCWDRDLARPCVVTGHDTVVEGRWGPRDVAPEDAPPPWAEPGAETIGGEGWAATMLHDLRHGSSALADPQRGWCRLHVDDDGAYHDALRAAWLGGREPSSVAAPPSALGWLASLRIEGTAARFAWLGHERVLRLGGGRLQQLTTDHDLRYEAMHGASMIAPEVVAQLDSVPHVVTRGLPAHAPAEDTCDVASGDRFVLVDETTQRELERAAGGRDALATRVGEGTARDVARWARFVLLRAERERPVLIVDAGASIATRPARSRTTAAPSPSVRDLVERPADFHGKRVRFRGVYRRAVEVSVIADAWFEGEAPFRTGVWIADAEGVWLHDGAGERGHFGQYESELRGTLTEVDLSRARPIAPDRIRFARPYVPLTSEIVIERGLLHWIHDRRCVTRLGPDGRLPLSHRPERCRARARFCVGVYGNVFLADWEILDAEARAPQRATAAAPGHLGRYVEIEGMLVPTDRHPRLDGVLQVTPPSITLDPQLRHLIPSAEAVARFRSVLGAGRRVVVRGEVGEESLLRALSITDGEEPLDL